VNALLVVDVVEHRRDRRTLARTGDSRQQHHPLVEVAQRFHHRGEVQPFEVGNASLDLTGNHAGVPHLNQEVHAETPGLLHSLVVVVFDDMGKVGSPFSIENLQLPFVHHRQNQPLHFLFADGGHVQLAKRAAHADRRRLSDFQVQVGAPEFDQGPEQLVDFQFTADLVEATQGCRRVGLGGGGGVSHRFNSAKTSNDTKPERKSGEHPALL